MKKILFLFFLVANSYAQLDEIKQFNYLQSLFFDEDIDRTLILDQMTKFEYQFPSSQFLDEIYFLKSSCYRYLGERESELYFYLKLIYLIPESSLKSQVIDSVLSLSGKRRQPLQFYFLKNSPNKLLEKKQNTSDLKEKYFDFITFLYANPIPNTINVMLGDIQLYRHWYLNSVKNNDLLLFWQAKLYLQENRLNEALIQLKEIVINYPNSTLFLSALYEQANIYAALGKTEKALLMLNDIINHNPNHKAAPRALFLMASLFENKLKKLDEAYNNYLILVESFPRHRLVIKALKKMTDIAKTIKDADKLIDANLTLFESYAGDSLAIEALENLYTAYHLKNNDARRAEILLLLSSHTKSEKKSNDYLFKAANIYTDKIKNDEKAREILLKIMNTSNRESDKKKVKELLNRLNE
jgi:TolA-binding protein